jgi:molybdenum cofactor cytidylyltransferase
LISAVVLAAGISKRFGSQKLEHFYNGKPLLQWTLDLLRKFDEKHVNKVLISSRNLDLSKFDLDGFEIVTNEEPERGLSSSVKLTISKCVKSEGILFFLGDMPKISLRVVERVLSFGTHHIVFPSYKGIKGFPVFLPSSYFEEGMKVEGDVGLRNLIKNHEKDTVSFENGWECVYDVDTIEDLKDSKRYE